MKWYSVTMSEQYLEPSSSLQVDSCLSALQAEVENFVLRMAAEFPNRKEQLIFLINNYDMMLAVLSVSHHMALMCHGYHIVLMCCSTIRAFCLS